MNGKQYVQTQLSLLDIGKKASNLDLISFLKAISNAETVSPMVDPTLYRRAVDNMHAIKKLAKAAESLQTAFIELQEVIASTAHREMAAHLANEEAPSDEPT